MNSNKFLQRFQGKIHIIGKAGIQGLFGDKNSKVTVYTNNNFYQQNKYKTTTSLNKVKTNQTNQPKQSQHNQHSNPKPTLKMPSIHSKQSQRHSFLTHDANNVYDQQDQGQKKEQLVLQKYPSQRQPRDIKRITNYNSSRSLQKRKEEEYTKSGGLGANIGGDQWVMRKKKLDKMQLFSEQVKATNTKPKIPKQNKPNPAKAQQDGQVSPHNIHMQ